MSDYTEKKEYEDTCMIHERDSQERPNPCCCYIVDSDGRYVDPCYRPISGCCWKQVILLMERFKKGRRAYDVLLRDKPVIERILKQGALTSRKIAKPLLTKVRYKFGIEQKDL